MRSRRCSARSSKTAAASSATPTGDTIPCNTPLPDAKWLRLYHELGGEIITIGTDAHTPEFVGIRARETQELLKSCGLDYVCTFEKKKPVFHKI